MANFKTKYRLLVLLNQSKTSHNALANAVNLAKAIDGAVDVFYVKPALEIANFSNQIAMMRALEEETSKAKKTMKELVTTIAETEQIPIIYNFSLGNVIHQVEDHIEQTQPDIVVLGKNKPKILGFLGDGLTTYLLKNHKGALLISGNQDKLTTFNEASLGFLNETPNTQKIKIADELIKLTNKPLKLFKIVTNNSENKPQETIENTIVYEFDESTEISSSISKYINKNKINVLCVKRNMTQNISQTFGNINNQIAKTITKTEVPVLVLAN